jgi:hypothetical protein
LALIGRRSTPDEPWGENPFTEGTPAHRSWTETNLWTKEHLALFQAEMLESRPSEEASPKEFLDHGLKVLAGQFDIWARAFSRSVVPTDQAAGLYEQLLNELEHSMAANATRFTVSFLPEGLYTTEVRRLLLQHKQYWLGRMLRKVRKRKEANCAKAAANTADGVESSEAESRKPPLPAADRAEPGIPPSPRRGPKPDYETALRVAEIVVRVAGEDKWRPKLEDICFELDENAIPRPKTWKMRGHDDWVDGLSERHLVEKAIAHHLELAARHRKTFS